MNYFLDVALPSMGYRSPRIGRQHDRACWVVLRALDLRRDDIRPAGGGSGAGPMRVLRQRRTAPTTRRASDDGDGEASGHEPERATRQPVRASHVRLYRISDVMELLSVSRATVYRLVAAGKLRLVKIGRSGSRIEATSIDEFISGGAPQ
jgi:excisionase family DNA binding protein